MSNKPSQDTTKNDIETSTNNEGDSSTQRKSDTNTINKESPTATLENINTSALDLSEIIAHTCSNCGEPAQYLCIACCQSGPRYCSSKCQSEDWTKVHSTRCTKATRTGQLPNEEIGVEGNTAVKASKVYGRGN